VASALNPESEPPFLLISFLRASIDSYILPISLLILLISFALLFAFSTEVSNFLLFKLIFQREIVK
jgi:hypothetical protein